MLTIISNCRDIDEFAMKRKKSEVTVLCIARIGSYYGLIFSFQNSNSRPELFKIICI